MVRLYKTLVVLVVILFAVQWVGEVEWYPFTSTAMYSRVPDTTGMDYTLVRDERGEILNDDDAFYVSPFPSGDRIAAYECFGERVNACWDYFSLVATQRGAPVTIELWRLDFATGRRSLLDSLTITSS